MSNTSDLLMLARVTASLVVVLVVAVLAARLARRAGTHGRRGSLAVRERIALTRDTSAVVLEVGDRTLLIGVSAHQVTVLAELDAAGDGAAAAGGAPVARVPGPRTTVRVVEAEQPLTRRDLRTATGRRRVALPAARRGTGAPLDPRTWQQGLEALRDLTTRHG